MQKVEKAASKASDVTPVAYVAPDPTAEPHKNAASLAAESVPAPQAVASVTYSLADVIQAVLQNHPALSMRRQEVEAARGRLITAGLLPNPQWTFDTLGELPEERSFINTRVMFTVPLGPKLQWRTAAACSDIAAQKCALSQETRMLLLEAADAALEVNSLQEQAALQHHIVDLAHRLLAIQKDLFEAATTPYRNVVIAELTAGKAELGRRDAAARLDQAQVRLSRAMASRENLAPVIQGQLAVEPVPTVALDAVVSRALQVAPELAQSQAVVRGSQQQLAYERWRALPDLSIGPRVRTSLDGENEQTIGGRVQMDLPLFDRNQGRIAETAAMVNGNNARAAVVEVATLNDVRAAHAALFDAQSRYDYYRANIRPQMEQVEKIIQEAFADRAMPAYEQAALLDAFARMRLVELELRYQHERMRTRLELMLECRLQDLSAAPAPAPAAPAPPSPPTAKAATGS